MDGLLLSRSVRSLDHKVGLRHGSVVLPRRSPEEWIRRAREAAATAPDEECLEPVAVLPRHSPEEWIRRSREAAATALDEERVEPVAVLRTDQ